MNASKSIAISYFPGCSLATSAKEGNQSLIEICGHMGYRLVELDDWSCCGSSSIHSIKPELGFHLACRNLSLAPEDRPLLVACPKCILNLRHAQKRLQRDEKARSDYERRWKRPVDLDLKIIHFFDLMDGKTKRMPNSNLKGLRFVPYYGCMLARPPDLRHEKNYHGLMEKLLFSYGADPLPWSLSSRCCGTFLSVTKPEASASMVNQIVENAIDSGAECIVTACAMCHLNIEIRCTLKDRVPVLHFSEILSLALKTQINMDWFARHLIDPVPIFRSRNLIA